MFNVLDVKIRENGVLQPDEYKEFVLLELGLAKLHMGGLNTSDIPAKDPVLNQIVPGSTEPIDKSGADLKAELIEKISQAFNERASSENQRQYYGTWKKMFEDHLENPALLRNFIYFDIPNSDAMILFYIHVWQGNMAMTMEYLHNEAPYFKTKNLKGNDYIPGPDDSWFHMSHYESMNQNERAKATRLAKDFNDFYKNHQEPPRIVSLGAGNLPERFYGLPKCIYTALDTSPHVLPVEKLFPGEDAVNTFNREHCNYLKEDLSKILQNHPELAGKQDFVVLLGGSMYLPDEAIIGIMKMAKVLLRPGGKMVIDYLILTNSMRRVGVQGWPVNPANMQISQSLNDACDRADKIIEAVNSDFQSPSDKELAETYAHVNTFEPWGDQSVMFEYELY